MSLRTPNPYANARSMLDLQRVKEQMALLQEQISTGKRITRPSEDPTGAALIVDFRNSIEQNNQYVKQADSAASFLQSTESALMDGVNTELLRLMELGTQALGNSTGASGRLALAPEVDGIRTNLISLANTQQQGKYLFAGSATTTVPFASTATGAAYSGNNEAISLDVSISAVVATNVPGDTVFFGQSAAIPPTATAGPGSAGDLFTQVTALRDALTANDVPGIQAAYDNLKNIYSRMQTTITDLGGRQASLGQLKEMVGDFNTNLQGIQDSYEAVDLPQAITDYQRAEISQQAALSILGRSNQQNLFNYLA